MKLSVVVLTYRSERNVGATLEAASRVSDDLHVVDSFSDDGTVEIARGRGARVVQRAFAGYAEQRNWAIDNLPLAGDWELHLDADERLSDELVAEIAALEASPDGVVGYHLPVLQLFLGREIRHGGRYPVWHLRLFARGRGRCEDRLYDQHFLVEGRTARLRGPLVDDLGASLSEWTRRHVRWAELEVAELTREAGPGGPRVRPSLLGSPIEQRRAQKGLYYSAPILLRPFLYFLYRYFFQLGFLDGRAGLVYHVLQGFWFRFLVDAKLLEHRLGRRA